VHLHHIALRTADVPALERFYADVFELQAVRREGTRSVWLDAGGIIVMIEQIETGEPRPAASSKELMCFAIQTDQHPRVRARLAERAVVIEARTKFTLYFRDPDGRRVGVSAYPVELAE
jgi:catechol 2,3-dioxygenase-like lactoylglutathione lyase family enzyme